VKIVCEEADMATVGGSILNRGRADSLDVEFSRVSKAHQGLQVLTTAATLQLAFQSIGVVYGDIGTSPLYVFSSTFTKGIAHQDDIIGAFSLIIYSLTLLPLLKYVFIVLQANDNGEGGTFALYSLICRHAKISLIPNHQPEDRELSTYQLATPSRQLKRALAIKEALEQSNAAKIALLVLALIGTSMVIGDGVLTPCISVLSAVGGITNKLPMSQDVVVWISVAILILLFLVQRFGTDHVGYAFSPFVLTWFLLIAGIGVYNLVTYDSSVLRAFYPKYIIDYFKRDSKQAWISLGGIVLCITGNEALFADLGHFSVRSIQVVFIVIVYPSLILAYGGQASYLRKFPENVESVFYLSIPDRLYWPMFVVSVAAAIIASQAMISATFSILKQSMALGCFPRVKIIHTSKKNEGQVYIPEINYILMVACVIVTLAFRTTTLIGNAYGIAVLGVMLITSMLVTLVMLMIWQTNLILVAMFVVVFGSIELIYYSACLYKFPQGGYLPLAFAAVLLSVMCVWHYVHIRKYAYDVEHKVSNERIRSLFTNLNVTRVPGIALLFSELAHGVPPIFPHFITNLPSIHSVVVFVSVKYLPVSTVPAEERFRFRQVNPKEYKMYRCVALYGYKDIRIGNVEFETELLESLKQFILTRPHQIEIRVSQRFENNDHLTDKLVGPEDGEIQNQLLIQAESELQQEVDFLEKARESGEVVYFLGESQLSTRKGSSLVKKFVVNYAYHFLRRNCRQGTTSLDIPHRNILHVGMNYQI
jgi:KUP system potassium uptake protein